MIVQLFVRDQLTSLLLIAPEHNIASARIYTVLLIALCASREPKVCPAAGCDNQGLQSFSLSSADTREGKPLFIYREGKPLLIYSLRILTRHPSNTVTAVKSGEAKSKLGRIVDRNYSHGSELT